MTDRPIIFSAPMIPPLIREAQKPGTGKTQTRRLATSPLRKCAVGDRLYVRESGIYYPGVPGGAGELFRHDVPIEPHRGIYWSRNNGGPGASYSLPACSRQSALANARARVRPSIHMPRWASRLTLIVEGVKVEQLQAISEADCLAEGPRVKGYAEFGFGRTGVPSSLDGVMVHTDQDHVYATPRCWYRELWQSLHTAEGQRWEDNPEIVALTFRVVAGNIDQVPA